MRREPTLPLSIAVCEQHIGFRSPWPVRLRFRLFALRGKAWWFRVNAGRIRIFGWYWNGANYVVSVETR